MGDLKECASSLLLIAYMDMTVNKLLITSDISP